MRIALISQNATPGILIFRKEFIRHLLNEGHVVYAYATDYTDISKEYVRALGAIPISYTLDKAGINPFRDIFDIWNLSRNLKNIGPDVVFAFFVKPSIYAMVAATLAGVPRRIALIEGLGHIHTKSKKGFGLKKRFLRRIHGLLSSLGYYFSHQVLFLNSDDVKDLASVSWISPDKFKVIGPIGLNLSSFPYCPVSLNKPVRFIFIGRLLVEKGVFEYIYAARLVKAQYPKAEFWVLGDLDFDNPSALSKAQLDEMIADGVITYHGHILDVAEYIAESHVFVLPSYREGFPRSTQEAMAVGRAVITTDVPGCRDTVIEGKNGFIVRPRDSQAVADKMKYLIENPSEIRRMGDESHRMAVARFDVFKINPILYRLVVGEAAK